MTTNKDILTIKEECIFCDTLNIEFEPIALEAYNNLYVYIEETPFDGNKKFLISFNDEFEVFERWAATKEEAVKKANKVASKMIKDLSK